jgi:beta-glucosidase
LLAISLAAALAAGGIVAPAANAYDTDPAPTDLELAHAALSREAATEGMVLLENHDALPLPAAAKAPNIALFGTGSQLLSKGGQGSGDVNNRYIGHDGEAVDGQGISYPLTKAFEDAGYHVTTSATYSDQLAASIKATPDIGSGMGARPDYAAAEVPLTDQTAQPTQTTDTAVYVVARSAGEFADRTATQGDYYLGETEQANLELLGATYKTLVVVLNVGGMYDVAAYQDINDRVVNAEDGRAIDAILLAGQPGQQGGQAIVDVLTGAVNPSGKLTDTWASQYSYYPASATFGANDGNTDLERYSEDIYVGYRYFDSFQGLLDWQDPNSVVAYPFGYGGSYTTFRIDQAQLTAPSLATDMKVAVTVTNTGKVAGKDTVQVYFSAPGTDVPYQELAAYAKTDLLGPGESQRLTLHVDPTDMARYHEATSDYILRSGDYAIRVGDSSRATHVAGIVRVTENTVTRSLTSQLRDQVPDSLLTTDRANFYSYPEEAAELAAAPVTELQIGGFATEDGASRLDQSVPLGADDPLYAVEAADGGAYGEQGSAPVLAATTTAHIPESQAADWDGTGQPYQAKTGETVEYVPAAPGTTLWDVAAGRATMTDFVAGLSVEQLANIVEGGAMDTSGELLVARGTAGYTTAQYKDLGIPGMSLSDGPAGLRLTQVYTDEASGASQYQYATAFPVGTLLAQTFDQALVTRVYEAIGQEMAKFGVTLWLAPGMNIHRDPLCGRNFEYYSEDPLVAGLMGAWATRGVQATPGVGVTLKHFFGNNQEENRSAANDLMSERAAREIYLRGFEIAVEMGQPMAVMSSYNRVNGSYTAGEYDLLTDILRGEWGFQGLVMTDWGGVRAGIVNTMYAGNDLIEPGKNPAQVIDALRPGGASGNVTEAPTMRLGDVQRSASRILGIAMQSIDFERLAAARGVAGVDVAPYGDQFELPDFAAHERGAVAPAGESEPTPTPSGPTEQPTGGATGGATGEPTGTPTGTPTAAPTGQPTAPTAVPGPGTSQPGKAKLKSHRPAIAGAAKVQKKVKAKTYKKSWTKGAKLKSTWYVGGKKVKTATALKLKSAWHGKKVVVKVTGKKAGYETVTRASKAKKIRR